MTSCSAPFPPAKIYCVKSPSKPTAANSVDARKLHGFLEVGRDFTSWVKNRIEKYGFEENKDYIVTLTKTGERQNVLQTDYHLSLDMAKELATVENTTMGRMIRRYLIRFEEQTRKALSGGSIEAKLDALVARRIEPMFQRLEAMEKNLSPEMVQAQIAQTQWGITNEHYYCYQILDILEKVRRYRTRTLANRIVRSLLRHCLMKEKAPRKCIASGRYMYPIDIVTEWLPKGRSIAAQHRHDMDGQLPLI